VNRINRDKLLAKKVPTATIEPVSIPTVTTVLVIDNTAYISTSMRGGSFLHKPRPAYKTPKGEPRHTLVFKNKIKCAKEVVDALATCQTKAEKDYGNAGILRYDDRERHQDFRSPHCLDTQRSQGKISCRPPLW
jgi:hypothetical protein